jgi:hypothetical protein
LIAASLAPFVAAMSFFWFRSEGVATASGEDAATVARIVCRGGTTTVETPIVRAQSDGDHLQIDADVQELRFSVDDDRGARGSELTPDRRTRSHGPIGSLPEWPRSSVGRRRV